jgi:activator of HSP90 ATPase
MAAIDRRDFAVRAGALVGGLGIARFACDTAAAAETLRGGEISRTNAAIHQEIVFSAPAARVYEALTVTAQFDRAVQLSAAMNSGMKKMLGTTPTRIDPIVGGAFTLFGGYVTGLFLELVPNIRIVQAWRAGSWDPGDYSIARFVLSEQDSATKLSFDHAGFPNEDADHLAKGWHGNYWDPLAKLLAG